LFELDAYPAQFHGSALVRLTLSRCSASRVGVHGRGPEYHMSDIFISYASEDRERAEQLAEALGLHGWTIWWDRKIPFGKSFDQVIEEQITEARCLIVLWSVQSVASDWVKNEAREGKARGVLIPVLIEATRIPLEFRHVQTANLVGWDPAMLHPEFDKLLRELEQLLGRPTQRQQDFVQPAPSPPNEAELTISESPPRVAASAQEPIPGAVTTHLLDTSDTVVPLEITAASEGTTSELSGGMAHMTFGETANEPAKEEKQIFKKRPFLWVLVLVIFVAGASFILFITRWERPAERRDVYSAPSAPAAASADQRRRAEDLYQQGLISEDAIQKAKLFREAAELGHRDAQSGLGGMYFVGHGVTQDYAESLRWHRQAAEQGHASAQNNLGIMYSEGLGVPKNDAEAVRWFRQAAETGYPSAQNNLGMMDADGRGVPLDEAEAVKWFRKAGSQGLATAQTKLGIAYFEGRSVPKDESEAVKWFRKAADQGDAEGQFVLGYSFGQGRGVARNYSEAVKWFRKAADQGDARGQFWLGYSYREGQGVARDYSEAVKWFRKAVDQKHAEAQWLLGIMHALGEGVAKNEAEAVKWFRKAAEQGHIPAQSSLGIFYASGRGVRKDEAEAVKWFRKAATQGDKDAQRELKKRGLDW
jgi:TPR repeat protein